jgi:hypothetical protein
VEVREMLWRGGRDRDGGGGGHRDG